MSITCSFRFDDPSPVSDPDLEIAVFEIFRKHAIPLTVAVVPFAERDGEPVVISRRTSAHLLDAQNDGTIEIALHGHSHKTRSTMDGVPSEFGNVPRAEQKRLLQEGLICLQDFTGTEIDGFVPPFNTYDENTLHASRECGIRYLSAAHNMIYRAAGVAVLPATCNLRSFSRAVVEARDCALLRPVVVTVFHPDDFHEYKFPAREDERGPFINLADLDRMLRRLRTFGEIGVRSIRDLALSSRHRAVLRHHNEIEWLRRLPWRYRARISTKSLMSSPMRLAASGIFTNPATWQVRTRQMFEEPG